jgi:hypothetical protein
VNAQANFQRRCVQRSPAKYGDGRENQIHYMYQCGDSRWIIVVSIEEPVQVQRTNRMRNYRGVDGKGVAILNAV